MTSGIFLFTLLFFCFSSQPVDAGELSGEMLDRLQEIHAGINNVSGFFIQEKQLSMLERGLVSRGEFAMAQPGKVYWAYDYPMETGFSSDGETLKRWSMESGKSQAVPLSRDPVLSVVVDQMLAWSTMDTKALKQDFSIYLIKPVPLTLKLVPSVKHLADIVHSVTIAFDDREKHIESIVIMENDGDKTVISFKNVSLNQDLPAELFAP